MDIAQFKTSITATPGETCELRVIQDYSLGVGARTGATLQIGKHEWGPELEVNVPIFYTTLADVCAASKTEVAATTTAPIKIRQDQSIESTSFEVTQTAIQCLSAGMINCPESLRTTFINVVEKTLTSTVSSGSDADFVTAQNTIVSTVPFGANALKMKATSGSPVSYSPPPPTTTPTSDVDGKPGNPRAGGNSNKVAIGVGVGVGVAALAAIIAGVS